MLTAKSSVDWMKEIPEGWQVKRIRDIFTFGKGLTITKADLVEKGIPVISYGQIHAKSNTGVHLQNELLRFVDESYLTTGLTSILQYGDIVFADTSEDTEGIGNCVFVDREDTVMAGYHTLIARTKLPEYAKYLAYLFKSECWRDQLRSVANGIKVFSITQKMLKACTVVLPSVEYSNKAVSFLDSTCSDIDTAIAEAKASIEDYKLLKQSIITKAVTKGLNPNVPTKDSGIEWIGEIPKYWTISKIKYGVVKVGSGKTPKGGAETYVDEGVLFIRSQNVYNEGLFLENSSYITDITDNEMRNTRVYGNDVLLNITGGSIGRCCIYPEGLPHANVNQHVCIIRTNPKVFSPKFMCYFWQSYCGKISIDIFQSGANREGMNFEQISNTTIPNPGIKEQIEIVKYLDTKCTEIDSLITEKEAMIADLEAYKKSLIFEVVTGKRKVC